MAVSSYLHDHLMFEALQDPKKHFYLMARFLEEFRASYNSFEEFTALGPNPLEIMAVISHGKGVFGVFKPLT